MDRKWGTVSATLSGLSTVGVTETAPNGKTRRRRMPDALDAADYALAAALR